MKYFFDNCISFRLPEMLAALGVNSVALRSEFVAAIEDVVLFSQLKGSGVVYLSADISQTTRTQEARALRECGVTECSSWGHSGRD